MRFRKALLLPFVGVALLLLTSPFEVQGVSVRDSHPQDDSILEGEPIDVPPKKRSLGTGQGFRFDVRKRSPQTNGDDDGVPWNHKTNAKWNRHTARKTTSSGWDGVSGGKVLNKRADTTISPKDISADNIHYDFVNQKPVDEEGEELTGEKKEAFCAMVPRAACQPEAVRHSSMSATVDKSGQLVYEDGTLVPTENSAGGSSQWPEWDEVKEGIHIDPNTHKVVDKNGIPLRGDSLFMLAQHPDFVAELPEKSTEAEPTGPHMDDNTAQPVDKDGTALTGTQYLDFMSAYFGVDKTTAKGRDDRRSSGTGTGTDEPAGEAAVQYFDDNQAIFILSSIEGIAPMVKGSLGVCKCKRGPSDGLYGKAEKSCTTQFSLLAAANAACQWIGTSALSCAEKTEKTELKDEDILWWNRAFCERCHSAGGESHPSLACGQEDDVLSLKDKKTSAGEGGDAAVPPKSKGSDKPNDVPPATPPAAAPAKPKP